MINVLITGDKGFIGSHFLASLNPKHIRIYTLPSKITLDSVDSISHFISTLPNIDYLYNFADVNGNSSWLANHKADAFASNSFISFFLISELSKHSPSCKYIFTGSVWALPVANSVVSEEDFGNPGFLPEFAAYAESKIYALNLLRFYQHQYGIHFTYFILPTIFGPGDSSDHLIPTLIRFFSTAQGNQFILKTDGTEHRTFLHVKDLVSALWFMRDTSEPILNIGSPFRLSVSHLVDEVCRSVSSRGTVSFSDHPGITTPELSTNLSEKLFGWPSSYPLLSIHHFLKTTDV